MYFSVIIVCEFGMGGGGREKQNLQDSLCCPAIHFAPTYYISSYNMVFGLFKFHLTSCEEKTLGGKKTQKKCSVIVEVALCTYRSLL